MIFKQAFNYKVVIARWLMQYWQTFSSFLIFCCYFTCLKASKISCKISETRKIFPILHSAPYDNNYLHIKKLYFIHFFACCYIRQSLQCILKPRWHKLHQQHPLNEIYLDVVRELSNQEFGSRWMFIEENMFGQSVLLMNATYIGFP